MRLASPAASFLPGNKRTRSLWVSIIAPWYETAEGFLAYRLKAEFTDQESPPRIGLRGTAKLFGDETTVFFFLFRRPLAKARQWLGW